MRSKKIDLLTRNKKNILIEKVFIHNYVVTSANNDTLNNCSYICQSLKQ